MSTVTPERKMGRPKGSGKSDRNDQTIKVDRSIVRKLRTIAEHRDLTIAEVASNLLKAPADREYLKCIRELERSEGESEKP